MRTRLAAALLALAVVTAAIVVPLVLSEGTRVKSVVATSPTSTSITPAAGQCGAVGFRTRALPSGLAVASGGTRALGVGETVAVAQNGGRRVDLTRGVDPQAFSLSLYSHGAVPLQVVTVLGQQATLFPAGAGAPGPRVAFSYPAGEQNMPCNRFQLEGVGISASELQSVAQGLVSTSSP